MMGRSSGTIYNPYPRQRRPTPHPAGLSPWAPPSVAPPGTYDPSLDFQGESEGQGYGFAAQDHDLTLGRAGEDYGAAVAQARTGHLARLGALGTALARANADYGTQTQGLTRSFQNLAAGQTDRARAAGAALGGATQQSAQKRQANQNVEQAKLDEAIQRFRADNQTATGQENQSWQDLVGADEHGGTLGTQFSRTTQDADTTLGRETAAHTLFAGPGGQLDRAKIYSAQQAGLLPVRPEGTYAALPSGEASHVFGGVEYGAKVGSPYLYPTVRPTAESVMATGSLRGTGLDPTSPFYHWPRRRR